MTLTGPSTMNQNTTGTITLSRVGEEIPIEGPSLWATFTPVADDYYGYVADAALDFKSPIGTYITVNDIQFDGNDDELVPVRNFATDGDVNIQIIESEKGCITHFEYPYDDSTNFEGLMPHMEYNINMTYMDLADNLVYGSIPDLSNNIMLEDLSISFNDITGTIPDLSNNIYLQQFDCSNNELTGSIPDLLNNTELTGLYCSNNQITGSIPDLSNNTELISLYCSNNQITNYVGNLLTVKYLYASYNLLTQAAVDNILSALVNGNVHDGRVDLDGSGNSAPSSSGLASVATLESRGKIVNVNS